MTGLEIIVILIICLSIFISLRRGITREIFSIIGLVGGIVFASRFYEFPSQFLTHWIKNPMITKGLGFISILVIANILIQLMGYLIYRLLKILALGPLDRLGGIFFGLVRGLIIITIIVIFLIKFPILGLDKEVANSKIIGWFIPFIKALLAFLPEKFSSVIEKFL